MLAQGHSNQEIAERLGVSVNTVRTHLHSLSAKLQATSRTMVVARAMELSLIKSFPSEVDQIA